MQPGSAPIVGFHSEDLVLLSASVPWDLMDSSGLEGFLPLFLRTRLMPSCPKLRNWVSVPLEYNSLMLMPGLNYKISPGSTLSLFPIFLLRTSGETFDL